MRAHPGYSPLTMDPAVARAPIRVLITDDQILFAEGIMSLLSGDERIEVVGHALDGAQAIELVRSLWPDLVLMDVSMPRMDGIEATRRIKEFAPEIPTLILTASAAAADVERATAAGAAGYLTKESASTDLIATVVELTALASAFAAASSARARRT